MCRFVQAELLAAGRQPAYGLLMAPANPTHPPDDPAVAPVEAILSGVAELPTPEAAKSLAQATYAVWICACVTPDDAPTWLIWEAVDGTLFWARDGDSADIDDAYSAQLIAGGHAYPGSVLAWLEGHKPTPWSGGSGDGDEGALQHLTQRLRGT
jgi:hypothetical protein